VIRRTVAVALWFLVGWATGGLVAFALGTPAALAPGVALLAAAVVAWDPTGLLWGPKPDRQRIARRIATLERVPADRSAIAPERKLEAAGD
jgi:hypothetical protein